jgi:hypothetical protein
VIAVGCAVLLRGGGGDDPIARAAASGTLGLGLGERPPSGGD